MYINDGVKDIINPTGLLNKAGNHMIGRTLGNYRIVEQIGIGGMATVYKAYDPDTDRYVAIKILPEHFSRDPTFRKRFQREAKAIAKLEHIHILPIFSYGEEDGIVYMAMRYLQAGTLTERIKQGPLPLIEAARLLSQIASALDYAHAHGVLHRDVKPGNILLDEQNNAFLTDFGIAKMVEATVDLTQGGILGTPAYMSPEQCEGVKELTPASDIYSLGVILYEMVTGRTPFRAETPAALIHMHLFDPLPPPQQLRPNLPETAQQVILKALAKEPASRYPTCGAMAAAFTQAAAHVAPAATPEDATLSYGAIPIPAENEATAPQGPPGPTAVMGKRLRPLPGWALGLLALLILTGLFGVAVATGLISFEQVAATPPPQTMAIPGQLPEDGQNVAPCDWEGLGPGLCITPFRGGKPAKIVQNIDFVFTGHPSWSPDGRQIAFSAYKSSGNIETNNTIHLVNADGSNLVELPPIGNEIGPAWSPNGQWLAFHSGGNLSIMRPNGSELIHLRRGLGQECAYEPQWSPDSQRLVYSAQLGECNWTFPMTREIRVISVANLAITPIATVIHPNQEACTAFDLAFSPDGSQVVYIDSQCQSWLANANGAGQPVPLVDFPFWWKASFHPQWGIVPPSGDIYRH